MQADGFAQDTSVPVKVRLTSGRGGPNVHFVPFRISIRPRVRPLTGSDTPAATQNFGDVQDTPVRAVSLLPAGIAALAIGVQPLPFQIEYWAFPLFPADMPTARQNVGDVQDSSCMPLISGFGWPGAGAWAQCWPSHRCAPAAEPRARQNVADGQDSPLRKPWLAFAG